MIPKETHRYRIPKVGKIFVLISIYTIFLIGAFFVTETIFRIKIIGYQKTISSYFNPTHQPSVLGVNDWVVSDPDLNYKLNPSKPHINVFSMPEKEIMIPKPSGLTRIIVLGDSISYSGDPSFVDLLKSKYARHSNIEILNASTPGYTTYQEMIFLKKYLLTLEPDLVILSYCLNDNFTFLHRFDENVNMIWTEEAEESLAIENTIDAITNKSYFLTAIKIAFTQKQRLQEKHEYPWEGIIDFNIAWKDYSWIDFSRWFKEMDDDMRGINGKLFMVIFPLKMQFAQELSQYDHELVIKPQKNALHYCNKYNIKCLDLFDDFLENINRDKELYTDGIHLSDDGHIISSEIIFNFINSEYFN